MTLGVTISAQAQEHVLADLCARNQTCELSCVPDTGPPIRTKVRFLELSGQTLLIDYPTVSGRRVDLQAGDTVQVHVVTGGQRLEFESLVQGRGHWFGAGTGVVDALIVQAPAQIKRAQRRDCYRLPMLYGPAVVVWFHLPVPAGDESREGFKGTLMDLSETGCGVLVDMDSAQAVAARTSYEAVFTLPGIEDGFALPAALRWKQVRPPGDGALLGFGWRFDESSPEHREIQKTLGRFIVEQQRQMLRRIRS